MFSIKRQRTQIILSFALITLCFVTKNSEALRDRDRGARCETPDYIPNGSYRIRRERVMRINCNVGFQLQGSKTIDCVRGKWEGEKPVCAKKGCLKKLENPENGRIQIENNVKAILYCSENYNLAGNRHSYCNGTQWDRPIGNCRVRKNVVQHQCDFESDDICGWTYEPKEGLEWKRIMAANVFTSFKTGPRYDHTTSTANGGHYMLMESLTRQDEDIILSSPIYDRSLSLKTACCFQFYYFMYGAGVGDLFVVVKPVSLKLAELKENRKELIKFQKYGNQNNIWNEAHFNIEELEEDFQILFLAKAGRGQLSDIAIDDVKLLTGDDCRVLDPKEEELEFNEEYELTTYESIFEMQSCVGRCFDSSGNGIIRNSGRLKGLCNCDVDCEDNDTCCPDFRATCLGEFFTQTSIIPPIDETFTKAFKTTTRFTPTPTTIKTTFTYILTTTNTSTTTAKPTTTTTTTHKPTPTTTTIKTTPSITTRKTTPTTTAVKTTPTSTTRRTTPTSTTRRTTPTSTTRRTTPTSTTIVTTTTTTVTPKTTPTTITTKTTPTTTLRATTSSTAVPTTKNPTTVVVNNSQGVTSTTKGLSTPQSIEYVINEKSNSVEPQKGYIFFVCTFVIIVMIIVAGAVYRRFGDRAVTWYMIRFKHNNSGDEGSPSITTSFNRPSVNVNNTDKNSKTTSRKNMKNLTGTKNIMKTPLISGDDEDDDVDDDFGANGNIALRNKMYTEL